MLSGTARARAQRPWRHRLAWAGATVGTVLCVVAAISYMADSDGLTLVNPTRPGATYLMVFLMIALDAVIPIFPGETTLNAASTAAAEGTLELVPVILMGALGAIVGDSALFWLARRNAHRIQPQVEAARRSEQVQQALAVMDSSAPVLIVAGRYVPGLRFVVNATMGLSTMPYRRFLPWSILGGALWSLYTCLLAYNVALALGDFPLASVVISGLVTTGAIAVVFLAIRRHRNSTKALNPQAGGHEGVSNTGRAAPEVNVAGADATPTDPKAANAAAAPTPGSSPTPEPTVSS